MNKTQTKEYIRKNIIKKYTSLRTDLDKKDFEFMFDILKDHENAKDKIGVGVRRMWLEQTTYGNHGFWLERIDGTKTDFSFLKCFSKTGTHSDYLKACRKAVEYIMIDYRDAIFADQTIIRCPILDIEITKHESHVDHHPYQFIKIARNFFDSEKQPIEILHGDGIIGVEFADKELKRRWVDFHNKYAKLRVISAIANQQLPKSKW